MNCREMAKFYDRGSDEAMQNGTGRRSFRYDELDPRFLYEMPNEPFINYLEYVNDYLELCEQEEASENS